MSAIRVIDEVYSELIDKMAREYAPYIDDKGNIRIVGKLPKLDVFLDDFECALYFNASNINLLEPAVASYVEECKDKIASIYHGIKRSRKNCRFYIVKGVFRVRIFYFICRLMPRHSDYLE